MTNAMDEQAEDELWSATLAFAVAVKDAGPDVVEDELATLCAECFNVGVNATLRAARAMKVKK